MKYLSICGQNGCHAHFLVNILIVCDVTLGQCCTQLPTFQHSTLTYVCYILKLHVRVPDAANITLACNRFTNFSLYVLILLNQLNGYDICMLEPHYFFKRTLVVTTVSNKTCVDM